MQQLEDLRKEQQKPSDLEQVACMSHVCVHGGGKGRELNLNKLKITELS